jgi:hypothetical protein
VVAAAVEDDPGVAELLEAGDCFRVIATPKFTPNVAMIKRNIIRDSLSPQGSLAGSSYGKLDFDVELVGHSTGGTAPEWAALLTACTLSGSDTGTDYTIVPISDSDDIDTVTLGFYVDGVAYTLAGCRGTVSLVLAKDAIPLLRFSFLGASFAVTDADVLALTADTSIPAPFKQVTMTIDNDALQLSQLTIDLAVDLELIPDITTESGYACCQNGERDTKGSFDPAMVLVATHDFFGKLKAGGRAALSAVWGAITAKVTLTAPAVQYVGMSQNDKGSVHGWNVNLEFAESSGDDEISLILGTATP